MLRKNVLIIFHYLTKAMKSNYINQNTFAGRLNIYVYADFVKSIAPAHAYGSRKVLKSMLDKTRTVLKSR